jgi:hypothetical protein
MKSIDNLTKKQLMTIVRSYQEQRPQPHLQENKKRLKKLALEKEIEKYFDLSTAGNKYTFTEKPRESDLYYIKTRKPRKSQLGIKKPRKVKFGKKETKQAEIILEAVMQEKMEEQQPTTREEENEIISEAVQEVQEILESHTPQEINTIVEEVKADEVKLLRNEIKKKLEILKPYLEKMEIVKDRKNAPFKNQYEYMSHYSNLDTSSSAPQHIDDSLKSAIYYNNELDKYLEELKKGMPVQEVIENIEVLPVKRSRGRPKKNNIKIEGSGMYNMTRRDGGGLMYHFPKTGRGMRHHNNGGSIFSSIDDAMNKLSVVPGMDGIPFYNLVHQYSKIGRKLFK